MVRKAKGIKRLDNTAAQPCTRCNPKVSKQPPLVLYVHLFRGHLCKSCSDEVQAVKATPPTS